MTDRPVIDAGGRFGRRRRRRRARIGVGLAALATVAAGCWLLLTSSAFAVHTVLVHLTVNPTSNLTRPEIARAARVPYHRPLVDVDVAGVRDRVADLPAVASVSVHRAWPHTLVLDVVARRAAVELHTRSAVLLADRHGVVYARRPAAGPAAGLPVVRIDADLPVSARPQPLAAAAVRAVDSLGPVRRHARHLEFGTATGLSFDDRGIRVVWGGAQASRGKAAELAAVIRRQSSRRANWVDVSTPGVLVTRHLPRGHGRDAAGAGARNHQRGQLARGKRRPAA